MGEEITDLISAFKKVLKNAMISDGVVRGLHGAAKALDAKKAQVCFLAENCSEPAYKNLVQALCAEHAVPLVEVSDNKARSVGRAVQGRQGWQPAQGGRRFVRLHHGLWRGERRADVPPGPPRQLIALTTRTHRRQA